MDSKTFESIPNAHIVFYKNHEILGGSIADQYGSFQLNQRQNFDTIVISALGFYDQKIAFQDLKDSIFLEQKSELLNEVRVSPGSKPQTIYVGEPSGDNEIPIGTSTGFEMICLIENPYSSRKLIYSFQAVIEKKYFNHPQFRVVLYSNNYGTPGNLVYQDTIESKGLGRSSTLEIDLSLLNLYLPKKGLFIGLECLDPNQGDRTNSSVRITYLKGAEHNGEILNKLLSRSPNSKEAWIDRNKGRYGDFSKIPLMGLNVIE